MTRGVKNCAAIMLAVSALFAIWLLFGPIDKRNGLMFCAEGNIPDFFVRHTSVRTNVMLWRSFWYRARCFQGEQKDALVPLEELVSRNDHYASVIRRALADIQSRNEKDEADVRKLESEK